MQLKTSWVCMFAALTVSALLPFSPLTHRAGASEGLFDWVNGDIAASVEDLPSPYLNGQFGALVSPGCTYQTVFVKGVNLKIQRACVYMADGFRYAVVEKGPHYIKEFVIGFSGDQYMYVVDDMPTGTFIPAPNTKHILYRFKRPDILWGYTIHIIKDLPSKLTRYLRSDMSQGYRYDVGAWEYLIKDEHGEAAITRAVGTSNNGEWLATEMRPGGLVRVNLKTFDKLWYSTYQPSYDYGMIAEGELTVSDDGQYAAVVGKYMFPQIMYIDGNCGREFDVFYRAWRDKKDSPALHSPCARREIFSSVRDAIGGDLQTVSLQSFNFDGGELLVYAAPYPRPGSGVEYKEYWVKLTAHGYKPPQLDYLALGDSFSSGEGDTERNPATNAKYYRTHTDRDGEAGLPREKCHISVRSYPYILSKGMALGSPVSNQATKWQTVACSGARAVDIIPEDRDSDRGQDSRLAGFDNYADLKSQALNEFIPGRQKQIEFVKKYKPKVITLTMGGNDVGFGDKIRDCITPITLSPTCKYVDKERAILGKQIKDQYSKLRGLYEQLYAASDRQAKIYVLGYPQIINGDEAVSCGLNVGALNAEERKMMNNSIIFMNNVIEQSARAAGVKYIDMERSLDGGRLCDEGQKYMTGITNIFGANGNENQESFHPNAKGHFQMAMTVWEGVGGESLLDYDTCPNTEANICPDTNATEENIDIPSYFESIADTNRQYVHMTSGSAQKLSPLAITTEPYTFHPSSTVNITIHSNPTDLGDFTVATDGSLKQQVQIPDSIPAGYHTLILTGETYSGEPIELEQILLVLGVDPDDIDENGTPDARQSCGPFLVASGIDSDQDGIDDVCDPELGVAASSSGNRGVVQENSYAAFESRQINADGRDTAVVKTPLGDQAIDRGAVGGKSTVNGAMTDDRRMTT